MKVHVAIMKKSWGLIPKILTGEKVIESRWYLKKSQPWGNIDAGDKVYFKNSGEPVTVVARVKKVLSFSELNPQKVKTILKKYGKADGIDDNDKYYKLFKNKKYCLLIYLDKPRKAPPLNINKSGFGSMSAWLTVDNIDKIRVNEKLDSQGLALRG